MKEINIITLNTAIDTLIRVNEFSLGKIIRSISSKKFPSGKGLNTARVLSSLESKCIVNGFVGDSNYDFFQKIENRFIKPNFTYIKGETRNNFTLINNNGDLITHIQNNSLKVSEQDIKIFIKNYESKIFPNSVHIISGSLPQNVRNDIYGELILKINKRKGIVILDTSEQYLTQAIKQQPFLIKPNLEEFEQLTGKVFENEKQIYYEMKKTNDTGISIVIVSMGKNGALMSKIDSNIIYKANLIDDIKYSTYDEIGCGDSMIAGIAYAINNNKKLEEILSTGIACGTANLFKEGPGNIDIESYKNFFKNIKINKIKI